MNLSEFKSLPSVKAHFGEIGPALVSLLTDHLIETADESDGGADHAQAEVGALKAIAHTIKMLRSVESGGPAPKPFSLKPLRRFGGNDESGEGNHQQTSQ